MISFGKNRAASQDSVSQGCSQREMTKCQYSNCGHAVVQLVEALRYKPEGRGFDSWWIT